MRQVKKRIVEYMAVRQLKNDKKGPSLSLWAARRLQESPDARWRADRASSGADIARGRARDGASPRPPAQYSARAVRIVQASRRPAKDNPVCVLDEVCQARTTSRAIRRARLLECSTEQNSSFSDHYLEVIVASLEGAGPRRRTASPIPWGARPPRDHRLPGYTRQEKNDRAQFSGRSSSHDHGLTSERAGSPRGGGRDHHSYTREAGVATSSARSASVCRAVAVKVAEGQAKDKEAITRRSSRRVLGRRNSARGRGSAQRAGLATARWTAVGGEPVPRPTRMPGKGSSVDGQLGDGRKESVTAALSFVRGRARAGRDSGNFPRTRLTATCRRRRAKDGPSAGRPMSRAGVRSCKVPVRRTGDEGTSNGCAGTCGDTRRQGELLAAHREASAVIIPNAMRLHRRAARSRGDGVFGQRDGPRPRARLKEPPPSIIDSRSRPSRRSESLSQSARDGRAGGFSAPTMRRRIDVLVRWSPDAGAGRCECLWPFGENL